jgi:hypothetical protein
MPFKYYLFILALPLFISSCGGGSSKTESSSPVKVIDEDTSILQLEESLVTNQSVDLILYLPDDVITNIKWQQTAGETVDILSSTTKVIGFTPQQPGDYSFDVSFNKNGGARQALTKTVFIEEQLNLITTRLAHEVVSGNKVSLRAELDAGIDTELIKWRQVEGPTVSLTLPDSTGQLAILFNAPTVSQDTYLSFEAYVTVQGKQHIDKVTILVEPASSISSNAYFDSRVAKVFSYNDDSPYKANLPHCVYSNSLTSSCSLSTLPLIAQDAQSNTPNIDTIMDRVVVSHRWMGDRFKEFLTNNDPNNDFKNLLRATTAIVISYDIRPSFYWAATGAIYLDANNFWLTPQERDTINEAPDYRADFGNDLNFVMPWRYVKKNDYASASIPGSIRASRDSNAGLYRLTSLMYHELAHANDFFPSTEWASHSLQSRILDAAISTDFESDQLSISLPLQSQTMRDLAQVSFAGVAVNELQKSYLPYDIQAVFSPDAATDFYAYSSLREDYAMLFEELMMQKRFNVYRDIAITNQPKGDNVYASDYIVTWGQRGRIGEENIKPRVLFSANRVLPEFDSAAALSNVPAPIQMINGDNWIENLSLSMSLKNSQKSAKSDLKIHQGNSAINHPYYHKKLPKH